MKVSYGVCAEKTLSESLVSLPQTMPPLRNLQSIPVEGTCATDSVQAVQRSMIVFCESSGEWNTSLLEGRCICKENTENKGGICKGVFRFVYLCIERKLPYLPSSRTFIPIDSGSELKVYLWKGFSQ